MLGVTTKEIRNKTFSGTGSIISDNDNAPYGIARYSDTTSNNPTAAGTIFTFELYSGRKAQLAFGHVGGIYYRYRDANSVWQAWGTL